MLFHYTYRITNILINKHYYGTRTSKINPKVDLGTKYFSSSSDDDFLQDQKTNPQNYKYKVIIIFDNRKEAMELEIKLHNKFNVGINENFYNKSKQTSSGFDFDFTGIPCSKEKKLKISKSLINHIVSEETRRKISVTQLGSIHSTETKNKMKKSHKGKHSGSLNNSAIIVNIYDNEDILRFSTNGNFIILCDENNLPSNALKKSYQNNTKIKIKPAMKYGYAGFIGWYAIKQ